MTGLPSSNVKSPWRPIADARKLRRLCPSMAISVAIMRFCVNVPVLSQQITVVQPRVSTDGRFFTSAWRLAMRWTPMASDKVTVGSSPSGTLATNSPMQKTKASRKRQSGNKPAEKQRRSSPNCRQEPRWHTRSRAAVFAAGFVRCRICWVRLAILPISEFIPVPKTTRASPTANQRSAGEENIGQLDPEKFAGDQDRLIGFVAACRRGFAGERGVVHFDFERFRQTSVGGNEIAFFEHDDIAGDERPAAISSRCRRG